MAVGKAVGEFSMKSTSVTVSTSAGGVASQINLEGTATNFGTVIGTMTFVADAPGAKTGRTAWLGAGYLENGEILRGSGEGFFTDAGKHKWRVRSVLRISNGTVLLADGELSLKGRIYKGTLHDWS